LHAAGEGISAVVRHQPHYGCMARLGPWRAKPIQAPTSGVQDAFELHGRHGEGEG